MHPLAIGLFSFAADDRISVDYNPITDVWSLLIEDVRTSDDGLYQCEVSSNHSFNIQLNVHSAAAADVSDDDEPIFRPAPTNITVSPGDRAALKCCVDNLGTKTVCSLHTFNS